MGEKDNANRGGAGAQNCIGQMGQLTEFNLKEDDFNAWTERFELYVALNEVNTHKKQLLFLTLLGNEGYALMRDLCSPQKPSEKKYEDLKNLLLNYINPKPNLITERYKFKERRQAANESVMQFVTKLKKMSEHCEFGAVLEDALRDQVIWGIRDSNIKKKLLSDGLLTFKKCVEISLAVESANNDVSKLDHQEEINYHKTSRRKNNKFKEDQAGNGKLTTINNNFKTGMETSSSPRNDKVVCYCCGIRGHVKTNCKYKNYSCKRCFKVGHLQKVCKSKSKSVNNIKEDCIDLNLSNLFNLDSVEVNFIKPYCVKLEVGSKVIEFQVDTGSAVSVMSIKDFKLYKLGCEDEFERTDVNLKAYNGSIIVPEGILKVFVKYGNYLELLSLYIVADGGQPLVGRDWLTKLRILPLHFDFHSLTHLNVVDIYPSVFRNSLGCFKSKTFKLYLKDEAKPIFCKPRVLPFSLKDSVSQELDRLVKADLLVPVESSEWATPIVPVIKPDKSIRLCGDYKVTINKYLEVDRYPIPRVMELMSIFQGAAVFCTLDLCQAYQQLALTEESQKLTTISTHKGLFMFKRLPYGVSSAPGILQREMENLFNDIPGTGVFYDDIVVSGKDYSEVNERLHSILRKLDCAGLTVKKEKCKFFSNSVTFLGYRIDRQGLHIPKERVNAITDAPRPQNVSEVKAFLGLVNYYSKFVKNMSSKAGALYALLKKDTKFYWSTKQEIAFKAIKDSIVSNNVLIHYNTEWELIVACDASPIGIGAVLSHRLPDGSEKPIAFASRTLTACERKYAQIDKEALALVFAVKYFHQYVYGRKFVLKTDHKPLVSIFGEKKGIPIMAAHRLQRYAVFLSGYSYRIEFIKGLDNGNADALSRLPLNKSDKINDVECDKFYINMITTNVKSISDLDIIDEIKKEEILKEVFIRVFAGRWPNKIKEVSEELKPYFSRKNELAIEQGCLMWGHRLIIPTKFREQLISELHSTHLGIVKMKSLARSYMWWPRIDKDIENVTKECDRCLTFSDNPPRSILHSWPWPEGPAQRIHLDFLGPINKNMFVCIIDAYSKWVFIKHMKDITSSSTIKVLREYFAYWGIPAKLVTDNGPSLCSEELELFLKNNGVFHIKTSPYNPSSNGAAENLVRTFKRFLVKCSRNSELETEIFKFILSYNTSKHCSTGVSPAELHYGRSLFTSLDRIIPFAKNKYDKNLEKAKRNYRGGRNKYYEINSEVMCRNYGKGEKWVPGVVTKVLSPVTYLVKIENGSKCKRHVNQLMDRVVKEDYVVNKGEADEKEVVGEENISDNVELRRSDRITKTPNRLNL